MRGVSSFPVFSMLSGLAILGIVLSIYHLPLVDALASFSAFKIFAHNELLSRHAKKESNANMKYITEVLFSQ